MATVNNSIAEYFDIDDQIIKGCLKLFLMNFPLGNNSYEPTIFETESLTFHLKIEKIHYIRHCGNVKSKASPSETS